MMYRTRHEPGQWVSRRGGTVILLEYGIAVLVRRPLSRLDDHGRQACHAVAHGEHEDDKSGYDAGRYAAVTWFAVAALSLLLWLLVAFTARLGFGVSGFDSFGVQLAIRVLTGIIIGSMILVGVIVARSPGRYRVGGKVSYISRRFGPSFVDFWVGMLVGVLAAIAL